MTADIRIADLFPSRWLKAKDLADAGANRITDIVTRATLEDVQPQPGEHVQRLALHLAAHKPYLVTSKADAITLAEAYGVTTASQLVGRQIAIKLDVWRRQAVLRIAPPPPATAAPKAKPPATNGAKPATTPPPVATTPPPPAVEPGEEPPPAPPVVPVADRGVEIWPPREPWVSRKQRTGEVDWVSTFWAGSAALSVPRESARHLLETNGGSFEDACREMWDERLHRDRADGEADSVPTF
jgi:hypothetical protein